MSDDVQAGGHDQGNSSTRSVAATRWGATIAATFASTWVLDVVASTTGALLVAWGVLAQLSQPALLVVFVASYVLWFAAMATNLDANWRLLGATGTSTNALSKLGFDLASARWDHPRPRKIAAAGGYVLTELVKELPYWAGAFGAAGVSDSVDATDAMVFLIGADLGAALYELCTARLTRMFLRHRSSCALTS